MRVAEPDYENHEKHRSQLFLYTVGDPLSTHFCFDGTPCVLWVLNGTNVPHVLKGVNQDPTLFQDLKVRVCQTKTVDPNDLVF